MKFIYSEATRVRQNGVVLSFFFNARGNELDKTINGMYRSLLLHLLEDLPHLQEVLDRTDAIFEFKHSSAHYTTGTLQGLLGDAIKKLGKQPLTCFIDALDECDDEECQYMIQNFEHLGQCAANLGTKLYICFSSRHYPHIRIQKGRQLIIENQEGHDQDVQKYVQSELKVEPEKLKDEITTKILSKSSGVFMWVFLVVGILNRECLDGRQDFVGDKLDELPPELSELFLKILGTHKNYPRELLLGILWILHAKRPLRPEEFYFAVLSGSCPDKATKPWDKNYTTAKTISQFVTSSTKGLAEVTTSKPSTVQFIHESVRDFFASDKSMTGLLLAETDAYSEGHEQLKQCCHSYLQVDVSKFIDFDNGLPNAESKECKELRGSILNRFPFLEYAAHNILYHADKAGSKISQDRFLQTFDLTAWINFRNLFELHQVGRYVSESLVYILADNDCAQLLRCSHNPDTLFQEGGLYNYPLFAAFSRRYQDVAMALLDLKRDFVGDSITALHCWFKVHNGSSSTRIVHDSTRVAWLVRLFTVLFYYILASPQRIGSYLNKLYHKPDNPVVKGATPLSRAAATGMEKVVRMLLDQSADVNFPDNYGYTPLAFAIEARHREVVRILVDGKANVNLTAKSGKTPLALASGVGDRQIVQILLHADAKVSSSIFSPLSAAAERGNIDIIQLLLDNGADPNYEEPYPPLIRAIERGDPKIVKLLLDNKANVNVRVMAGGRMGGTPIQFAARSSGPESIAIVQLLLNSGADVNAPPNEYGDPALINAVWNRIHKEEKDWPHAIHLVQLLAQRADLSQTGHNLQGRTALGLACCYGLTPIVEVLLEANANVNVEPDVNAHTPLSYAQRIGNKKIEELLRLRGAGDISTLERVKRAGQLYPKG